MWMMTPEPCFTHRWVLIHISSIQRKLFDATLVYAAAKSALTNYTVKVRQMKSLPRAFA